MAAAATAAAAAMAAAAVAAAAAPCMCQEIVKANQCRACRPSGIISESEVEATVGAAWQRRPGGIGCAIGDRSRSRVK